jgi:hypothetical protein
MAESKVKITIGSVFNDSGFSKATQATQNLGNQVRKAGGLVGQLSGAFGGLSGTAGKAANAIGGLIGALSGGLIGVAIASITIIVSKLKEWKDRAEEA